MLRNPKALQVSKTVHVIEIFLSFNREAPSNIKVIKLRISKIISMIVLKCDCVFLQYSNTTELNDLRKIICLRKSEVSVERISVCNVIGNLVEHGIHCLPYSYTIDIINMFK